MKLKRVVLTLEVQTELPVKLLRTIREISITEADLRLLKESDEEAIKKVTVITVAQTQANVIRPSALARRRGEKGK